MGSGKAAWVAVAKFASCARKPTAPTHPTVRNSATQMEDDPTSVMDLRPFEKDGARLFGAWRTPYTVTHRQHFPYTVYPVDMLLVHAMRHVHIGRFIYYDEILPDGIGDGERIEFLKRIATQPRHRPGEDEKKGKRANKRALKRERKAMYQSRASDRRAQRCAFAGR
jgi:hypothetical protein